MRSKKIPGLVAFAFSTVVAVATGCSSSRDEEPAATATSAWVGRSVDGLVPSRYLTFPWYYWDFNHGPWRDTMGELAFDLYNLQEAPASVTVHFRHPETGQPVLPSYTTHVGATGQARLLVGRTPEQIIRGPAMPGDDLHFNVFIESSVPLVGFVTWGISWGTTGGFEALENDPAVEAEPEPEYESAYPSIRIDDATYGGNCGAPAGNATARVTEACADRAWCILAVKREEFNEPESCCKKELVVTYRCDSGPQRRTTVEGDAHGRRLILDCEAP